MDLSSIHFFLQRKTKLETAIQMKHPQRFNGINLHFNLLCPTTQRETFWRFFWFSFLCFATIVNHSNPENLADSEVLQQAIASSVVLALAGMAQLWSQDACWHLIHLSTNEIPNTLCTWIMWSSNESYDCLHVRPPPGSHMISSIKT